MKLNKNKKKILLCLLIVIISIIFIIVHAFSLNSYKLKSGQINNKRMADTDKTYTIVFDANGGTGAPNSMTSNGGNIIIPSTVPTKSGNQFWIWKIKGSDVSAYPGGTFNSVESYADSNGVVTFVAQWGYRITFDANGGTGAPDDIFYPAGNVNIPSTVPTKSGNQFWIWKIKGSDVSAYPGGTFNSVESYADSNGVVTFVAQWGYRITFDTNGGTGAPDDIFYPAGNVNIPSTVPTKSGNQFWIWKIKGSDVSAYPGGTFNSVESYADSNGVVTFVAQWGYKIVYDTNGGVYGPDDDIYPAGNYEIPSDQPYKEGYTFVSWKVKDKDIHVNPSSTINLDNCADSNGVVTFVAEWEKEKAIYTITYDANGGTGAPASQQKTEGESINLSSTQPTRDGYKFLGWSRSSSATTATYSPNATFTEDGNVTLYAVWEKEKAIYTITYDANGGAGAPASQQKTEGQSINLSSTQPTKDGYKFLGWSRSSSATTAIYSPNATFTEDGNVTLYAVWEKDKTDEDKTDEDKTDEDKIDEDKTDEDKTDEDKTDEDKTDEDKTDEDKTDEDKTDEDKTDEDKTDEDKTDEDKTDEDKVDEDKNVEDKTTTGDKTTNKNIINGNTTDNTKASTKLPNAGIKTLKTIIILVIVMCLIFGIKYKTTRIS